jgi:hypothetical protein
MALECRHCKEINIYLEPSDSDGYDGKYSCWGCINILGFSNPYKSKKSIVEDILDNMDLEC